MSDLVGNQIVGFPMHRLISVLFTCRSWLYEVCRGFDHEPVSARQLPKSIGCSKNFTGKNCLDTREKVSYDIG